MAQQRDRSARAARVVGPVVVGAAMLGLWFVFAGSLSWHELAAGVAGAVTSTFGWWIATRRTGTAWGGRAAWFAQAARLPAAIVSDTWTLLLLLARQLVQGRPVPSLLVAIPFEPGTDARSATRRALAIAFTGTAPGTVVVDIDSSRRLMLVHHVSPGSPDEIAQALGSNA